MIQQNRLVERFLELVQVDSETKCEQEISRLLKQKFAELGLNVIEDDSASRTGHGSGNLIATLEATEEGKQAPSIFFTAHMDTVAPGRGIKPSTMTGTSEATARRYWAATTKPASLRCSRRSRC